MPSADEKYNYTCWGSCIHPLAHQDQIWNMRVNLWWVLFSAIFCLEHDIQYIIVYCKTLNVYVSFILQVLQAKQKCEIKGCEY